MNKYYFFIKNHETLGPVSKEQLLTEIGIETLVCYEGLDNWKKASEIPELLEILIPPPPPLPKTISIIKELGKDGLIIESGNGGLKIVIIVLLLSLIAISGYFLYSNFHLTEKAARDTSTRFFNLLTTRSFDSPEIKELYPTFNQIGTRISLKDACDIRSVSLNNAGDYEIYASYGTNKNNSYPITLTISKTRGQTIIKSSKGLNYAYYDKVLEFGKKKGCLTGSENDAEMGIIISNKRLRDDFEILCEIKSKSLYDNLQSSAKLERNYGMTSGDVTIVNNNDIDFGYFDIDCRIEFYDSNNQITSSSPVYCGEINSYSSKSSHVYSSVATSVRYKIIPTIKNTEELKERIKNKVIESTSYGCY